jgi:hypothetical protein
MLLVAFSKLAETLSFDRTLRSLDLTFGTDFWFIFCETGAGQSFARVGFWFSVFGFC